MTNGMVKGRQQPSTVSGAFANRACPRTLTPPFPELSQTKQWWSQKRGICYWKISWITYCELLESNILYKYNKVATAVRVPFHSLSFKSLSSTRLSPKRGDTPSN